jgi:hypothetical protein
MELAIPSLLAVARPEALVDPLTAGAGMEMLNAVQVKRMSRDEAKQGGRIGPASVTILFGEGV